MSRGEHIKPLNAPEPPEQQPLPFPRTNLQFGPPGSGFAVQLLLADDIAITKAFSAQAEEEICNILIQRRKERKEQERLALATIQHINQTKN